MTRKRGGAKKKKRKKNTKKLKKSTRNRSASVALAEAAVAQIEKLVDEGLDADTPQRERIKHRAIAAAARGRTEQAQAIREVASRQKRKIHMTPLERKRQSAAAANSPGSDSDTSMTSNSPVRPSPSGSSAAASKRQSAAEANSPGSDSDISMASNSPERPSPSRSSAAASSPQGSRVYRGESDDPMLVSPQRIVGSPVPSSAAAASTKPLIRQLSPSRPRGQGSGMNGLSMSVTYKPGRQGLDGSIIPATIPGWYSTSVPYGPNHPFYHVPIFGISSFTGNSGAIDEASYTRMMNLLDTMLNEYQSHTGGAPGSNGVVRFMEVYIHAHNGTREGGCKVCGKRDSHNGIRIEATIPSMGDQNNKHLSQLSGFDLLKQDFYLQPRVADIFLELADLIPSYIADIIDKNNMGQLFREILYTVKQNREMGPYFAEDGNNVICIPLDYYRGRAAGLDPATRPFGFHKDTIDNKTLYVNLSFDNPREMYSASIIQCHTDDADRDVLIPTGNPSDRCKRALRFKLKKYGTIGFSDFLLAHTTPTGLCSMNQNSSVLCGSLGRDTTTSRDSATGIITGKVGVSIQNVDGASPPANTDSAGNRREWTVEFDTRTRIPGGPSANRPNFIRSWFTFFTARDKSQPQGAAARDKYELAIETHDRSIWGRLARGEARIDENTRTILSSSAAGASKGQDVVSAKRLDLKFDPLSDGGYPSSQQKIWNTHVEKCINQGLDVYNSRHYDEVSHADPSRYFKIKQVKPDIEYRVLDSVAEAFRETIALDNQLRLANREGILTGGKKSLFKKKRSKNGKKRKGRKTKKRRSQKRRKRKRSRKRKKRKSKRKNT